MICYGHPGKLAHLPYPFTALIHPPFKLGSLGKLGAVRESKADISLTSKVA